MSKLTEATLIPLSLVITIIGGVVWLSVIYSKVEAHQEKLTTLENRQSLFDKEVIDRLARIEEQLKSLKRGRE